MTLKLFSKLSVRAVAVIGLASSLIACSPESPKLVELPLVKKERVKNTGDTKVTFNRSVDILFVVMTLAQWRLIKRTWLKIFKYSLRLLWPIRWWIFTLGRSRHRWIQAGRRRRAMRLVASSLAARSMLSDRHQMGTSVLEKNLNPGTGGSGEEEFFSPIRSALSAPLVNGKNAGFYRQDAYLAVVFLTDSDDQSSESAQDIYNFLLNLKGGDASKIITYGVYIPTTVSSCDRSGEPEPNKLETLFKISNAKTLGLCDSDYGKKLAELGDDLGKRLASVLYLSRPADPATITVAYGTQIIPNDPQTGWIYDPSRNALVLDQILTLSLSRRELRSKLTSSRPSTEEKKSEARYS